MFMTGILLCLYSTWNNRLRQAAVLLMTKHEIAQWNVLEQNRRHVNRFTTFNVRFIDRCFLCVRDEAKGEFIHPICVASTEYVIYTQFEHLVWYHSQKCYSATHTIFTFIACAIDVVVRQQTFRIKNPVVIGLGSDECCEETIKFIFENRQREHAV